MSSKELSMCRRLAPEDIRPGQYVAVYSVIEERLPFLCADPEVLRQGPVRIECMPIESPAPLKVVEVCLPLVLVEAPDGSHGTLDVRLVRLMTVSKRFGRKSARLLRRGRAGHGWRDGAD